MAMSRPAKLWPSAFRFQVEMHIRRFFGMVSFAFWGTALLWDAARESYQSELVYCNQA
jgi:hypothetical protein